MDKIDQSSVKQLVLSLLQKGQAEQALIQVRQAIKVAPEDAAWHELAAQVYLHQNRHNQAIRALQKAISLDPARLDWHHHLANTLMQTSKDAAARNLLQDMTQSWPEDADAWLNLGIVQRRLGAVTDALVSLDHVLSVAPNDWRAWYSKGNCLQDLRDPYTATECYQRALQIAPDQQSVVYNLSAALSDQAKPDEALAVLDRFDTVHDLDWQINRALLLLQTGKLLDGLSSYQRRFSLPGRQAKHQDIPSLEIAPDSLNGKTVLLWGEQGFGDSIQFIRFADRLRDRGAHILFDGREALHDLIGQQRHLVNGIWHTGLHVDYQYPLMSLPLVCSKDDKDIGPTCAYLSSSTIRGESDKIAVVWSGYAGHQNDHNRSLPDEMARHVMQILRQAGFVPVSLQMAANEQHQQMLKEGVIDDAPGDRITSFTDTAAILQSCRGLVSVDTAAIHVAGALGIPGILLLPHNPDWRWGLKEGTSAWYDSITQLRQQKPGDWQDILQRLPATIKDHFA